MPKIIEHLREQLLEEAKRQIGERGFSKTTVRSVAAACGVGVGTVYNYFESKEILIASFILEDWKAHLSEMKRLPICEPRALLWGIYDSLRRFAEKNETLFSDPDAAKLISTGSSARHKMLREQIASVILPVCERNGVENPRLASDFVSEALICWSMEGVDFDTLYPMLEKIIQS